MVGIARTISALTLAANSSSAVIQDIIATLANRTAYTRINIVTDIPMEAIRIFLLSETTLEERVIWLGPFLSTFLGPVQLLAGSFSLETWPSRFHD